MSYIDGYYRNTPSYRKYKEYDAYDEYNYSRNMFTGIKWECIEFIRRYFIEHYKITFMMVKNVYDIHKISHFFDLINFRKVPLKFFPNYYLYETYKPKIDDLVIFNYEDAGHVAIISDLTNPWNDQNVVKICEQNWERLWESKDYSRHIYLNDPSIIGFFSLQF